MQLTNTKKSEIEGTYKEITSLLMDGIGSWVSAGKIVVNLIDEGNNTIQGISEKCNIPAIIITKLEKLGRGLLLPELLLATYPAASSVQRLSAPIQKQVIDGGVEVLIESGESLHVKAENLTPLQCKQVFDAGAIRPVAAQRAWVESEKMESSIRAVKTVTAPYEVRGAKIIINGPCSLTMKDLHRMLSEIEK